MDAQTAHAAPRHALQHGNAKIQQQNIIRIQTAVSARKLAALMDAQMEYVQSKAAWMNALLENNALETAIRFAEIMILIHV